MISYPEVNTKDSRVFFLFPFRLRHSAKAAGKFSQALLSAPLSALLKESFIPVALKSKNVGINDLGGQTAKQKIWHVADRNLSADFHPHIAKILGRSITGVTETDGQRDSVPPQLYQLTPDSCNLLTGGWGTRGAGFELPISVGAQRRLGARESAPTIRGLVEDGYVQIFRSGIGILVLEISYRCDKPHISMAEVMLEANYSLCHTGEHANNLLCWASVVDDNFSAEKIQFSLNELARSVIFAKEAAEDHGSNSHDTTISWLMTSRIFTYSMVQFKSSFADRAEQRRFAYRLCSKYTSDYVVNDERVEETLTSTFLNVVHGSSIEGGCVVIEEGDIEFLKSFANAVGRLLYLQLVLVSFHEFLYLVHLTQESTTDIDCKNPSPAEIDRLRCLKYDLVTFHLLFRFSHASYISHHNLVHSAWRRAFSLDRMLEEVTSDVVEAEKVLTENSARRANEIAHNKAILWHRWASIATGVAAFLALSHLIEIGWRLFPRHHISQLVLQAMVAIDKIPAVRKIEEYLTQVHFVELRVELVAMCIAIGIGFYVFRRKPVGSAGSDSH